MSQTPATRRQLRGKDSLLSSSSSTTSAISNATSTASSSPTIGSNVSSPGLIDKSVLVSKPSKIRTRLSTGTLVMNGTSTMKEKDTRTLSSSSSALSLNDSQGTGSKRRSESEMTVPVPPKRRNIVKSDGSVCDQFCWLCHKDDCSLTCPLCPRSYHFKCLSLLSVPSDWACAECEKIMEAGCMDTRSRAMNQINTDTLSLLLRYALDRMRLPGSEVFQKPANMAELPYYSDIVVNPMDFSTLEKNIKKKEYGSTEEFMADAKWIMHNCIIYNGLHHKLTAVARQIVKSCKHEMAEIEVCPQCYKQSCMSAEANWFVEACNHPHPLVWAKLKGYPFWPAKAMEEVDGGLDVRFFGAHDKSVIPLSQVFMLSKDPPTSIGKKKPGFIAAMEEVNEHVENLKKTYGNFEYAPPRTPYDKGNVYINFKQKGASTMVNKHIKMAAHGRFAAKKETEKVSVTSKTASAVKSKYSSLFNKKVTSITTPTITTTTSTTTTVSTTALPATNTGIAKRKPGRPKRNPLPPDTYPETAEKAIRLALSDWRTAASKSLFINPTVKVTDIIQQKIWKQQEMEEKMEEDVGQEEVKVHDVSSTVTVEHEKQAKEDGLSSASDTEGIAEEKQADENQTQCEITQEITCQQGIVSSVSDSETAIAAEDRCPEDQLEKVGTLPGTGLEMKDKTDQETKIDVYRRSSNDGQGVGEKRTVTNVISESDKESDKSRDFPQEKVQVDDSLTKRTDKQCEPSAVTTEISTDSGRSGEEDKVVRAARNVECVHKESGNHQPVPSKVAVAEQSPSEQKTVNSSAVAQHSGLLEGPAVSVPASSEKQLVNNSGMAAEQVRDSVTKKADDMAAEQAMVSSLPALYSPVSSPDQKVTEVLSRSGDYYRDSLRKTIEACKGKLGISNVEEVGDIMDMSNDEDDSSLSKDDQSQEAITESQVSPESQDSRISSEKEEGCITSSTSRSEQKSDFETSLEKTKSSNEASSASSTPISKSDSQILTEKKQVLESDSGSAPLKPVSEMDSGKDLMYETRNSSTAGCQEISEAGVGVLPKGVVASLESCQGQGAAPNSSPQGGNVGVALAQGKSGGVHVEDTAAQPTPHTSNSACISAKQSVSQEVIAKKKIAKAASILDKAAESMLKMAQSVKPRAGTSDQPATVTRPSLQVSSLNEVSKTVPHVHASIASQPTQTQMITLSCGAPSATRSVLSNQKFETASGSSKVNPITIVDDDEPSLLMEVESVPEHREDQVINLDDDYDGSSIDDSEDNSQQLNSSVLARELAPYPTNGTPQAQSVTDQASENQSDIPQAQGNLSPKIIPKRLKKSSRVVLADSLTTSVAPSSSVQSSQSPLLSEPSEILISEVRSLIGTLHDWKECSSSSSSKKPESLASSSGVFQTQPPVSPAEPPPSLPQLPSSSKMPPALPVENCVSPSTILQQASSTSTLTTIKEATPTTANTVKQTTCHTNCSLRQATAPAMVTLRQSAESSPGVSAGGNDIVDDSPVVSTVDKRPGEELRPAEACPPQQTLTPAAVSLVNRPAEACPPQQTLTPAAVSLVNRYSQQIVGNMQLQLAEMSRELLTSTYKERENQLEQQLKEDKDQLQWTLTEVQHNHKTTVAEMKACWEAEMSKALQDMMNRMTREKEEAVAETKKKQWCAECWKEAMYYCCWNTSYCNHICQQRHWTTHQHYCRQVLGTTASTTLEPSASASLIVSTPSMVSVRAGGSNNDVGKGAVTGQLQRFPVLANRAGTVNVVQGAVRQPSLGGNTQPVHQIQYLSQNTLPANFQAAQQVQLMSQRHMVSVVLPTSALPLVRQIQPGETPTSQNVVMPNMQPPRYQ